MAMKHIKPIDLLEDSMKMSARVVSEVMKASERRNGGSPVSEEMVRATWRAIEQSKYPRPAQSS
jgi:hypothetical protein